MVISEINNEIATIRIHDESCRKETGQTMKEISRIVSLAYQRRLNAAFPRG